ncbi:Hypothetical protein PHPALM_14294 [Phytophthora palmivora]|uniref:Uncharacterized protein n=1 Tax=Phytophthora palmivora TaxID=4796 RepID=A0A2P4XV35_9STRA|nr:Hypothetical protein PHPALM_14294 [Phytophthora palmivora]
MVYHFIRRIVIPKGRRKVTIYIDNFVVGLILALTHIENLKEIDQKVFVKGYTKNEVHRGFGHVRKHISRTDWWTLDHRFEEVYSVSGSSALVHIPNGNASFKTYQEVVEDAYKKLKHVQTFQIL